MKHHYKGRKFNLKGCHRKALFRNLIIALIKHKIIITTVSKAKELRTIIEPIINRAKINTLANRRLIFDYVRNTYVVTKLFHLGQFYFNVNGGYTQIIKKGFRKGDNALMVYIKLSNFDI